MIKTKTTEEIVWDWNNVERTRSEAIKSMGERWMSVDKLQKVLDKHRKKSFITCEENCFCWVIDAMINSVEVKK